MHLARAFDRFFGGHVGSIIAEFAAFDGQRLPTPAAKAMMTPGFSSFFKMLECDLAEDGYPDQRSDDSLERRVQRLVASLSSPRVAISALEGIRIKIRWDQPRYPS